MKNKEIKKIQFGGYTKRSYKEVRQKVKKLVIKELQSDDKNILFCQQPLSVGNGCIFFLRRQSS